MVSLVATPWSKQKAPSAKNKPQWAMQQPYAKAEGQAKGKGTPGQKASGRLSF